MIISPGNGITFNNGYMDRPRLADLTKGAITGSGLLTIKGGTSFSQDAGAFGQDWGVISARVFTKILSLPNGTHSMSTYGITGNYLVIVIGGAGGNGNTTGSAPWYKKGGAGGIAGVITSAASLAVSIGAGGATGGITNSGGGDGDNTQYLNGSTGGTTFVSSGGTTIASATGGAGGRGWSSVGNETSAPGRGTAGTYIWFTRQDSLVSSLSIPQYALNFATLTHHGTTSFDWNNFKNAKLEHNSTSSTPVTWTTTSPFQPGSPAPLVGAERGGSSGAVLVFY